MEATVGGIKINYERIGSGKPVLLLHGWGANLETMRSLADHIASINREAVLMDFPASGKSGALKAPWEIEDYADNTMEFIRQIGIEGCDVLGHSFGCRVTIVLAAGHPELFGKIIMTGAAGILPKRGIKYYFRVYCYKLVKWLSKCGLINRVFRLDEKRKNAGSEDYRQLDETMKATFVRVVNKDLTPLLDKIQNETLLIWGEDDTATPLYMGKLMEQKIKNAGLAVMKNAGHYAFLDDYSRFVSIIDIILREKESQA